MRLRHTLILMVIASLIGTTFAQAQEEQGTECYQDALGEFRRLYSIFNYQGDPEGRVFPLPPSFVPTPAPVPPNNPPALAAAFYRFPLIEPGSQPQTWEELVYYLQSTGVTVDQTISDDDPSSLATVNRPVNVPLSSGMPVVIRAGELGTDVYTAPNGEITQTLEGNAQIEAESLETFGEWWHVRFANGTEGWVRLNDVGLQPPGPVTVTIITATPLTVSPSEDSAPMLTLEGENQPVEAIGRDLSGNWFKVRVGGIIGWIPASALQQNEQLEQARQQALSDGYSFRYMPPTVETFCDLPSGMVLQSPEDTPVYAYVNAMPIELSGTAVVTTSDISGDGIDETMFITVVDGQITTLLPNNPFTMTGNGETVGLELNPQGDIVGYTGVVPEEAQQQEILVNAAFICEMFNGFLYVRPANCDFTELPTNLATFVISVAAEPNVPGLEETEVAAQPEATALPEGVLVEFNDAFADVFNCQSGSPVAASASSLRADLSYIGVVPAAPYRDILLPLPHRRLVQIALSPQLVQDLANAAENFAIYIYTRSIDGEEVTYAIESHNGTTAYQGRIIAPRQTDPNTANLMFLDPEEEALAFNVPDDVVEIRFESYVEETPGTQANLCDRYPEQGFASLGVAEVL